MALVCALTLPPIALPERTQLGNQLLLLGSSHAPKGVDRREKKKGTQVPFLFRSGAGFAKRNLRAYALCRNKQTDRNKFICVSFSAHYTCNGGQIPWTMHPSGHAGYIRRRHTQKPPSRPPPPPPHVPTAEIPRFISLLSFSTPLPTYIAGEGRERPGASCYSFISPPFFPWGKRMCLPFLVTAEKDLRRFSAGLKSTMAAVPARHGNVAPLVPVAGAAFRRERPGEK